jgi:hypothetical protein
MTEKKIHVATTVRPNGQGGWISGGWADKSSIWVVCTVKFPGAVPDEIVEGLPEDKEGEGVGIETESGHE